MSYECKCAVAYGILFRVRRLNGAMSKNLTDIPNDDEGFVCKCGGGARYFKNNLTACWLVPPKMQTSEHRNTVPSNFFGPASLRDSVKNDFGKLNNPIGVRISKAAERVSQQSLQHTAARFFP